MRIVEARTVQTTPFRGCFEALKDILTETTISFDKNGLKIMTIDSSHTVLVYLKLDAGKFESYSCESDSQISVGINMIQFYTIIKTITNNDTLILYIEEANTSSLVIQIDNGNKNTSTTTQLSLLDLTDKVYEIPVTKFEFIVQMKSNDFQKYMRDMNSRADAVEIEVYGKQMYLRGKGDFAKTEMILSESDDMVFIQNSKDNNIVQGIFLLKQLVTFTKCTNLSSTVDIYLKNDYPLIVCYNVGSLGTVKLCLSPKMSYD